MSTLEATTQAAGAPAPAQAPAPEAPGAPQGAPLPGGGQTPAEPEAPAQTPAEARLARAYADIQRRDRELKKQAREFEAQKGHAQRFAKFEELSKTDQLAAVRELGLDPFALAGMALGTAPEPEAEEEPPKHVVMLREELAAVKKEIAEAKAAAARAAQEAATRSQLATMRADLERIGGGGLIGMLAERGGEQFLGQLQKAYDLEAEEFGAPPEREDFITRAVAHVTESYCTTIEEIVKSTPQVRERLAGLFVTTAPGPQPEAPKAPAKLRAQAPKPSASTSAKTVGGEPATIDLDSLPRNERLKIVYAQAEAMRRSK
jgi:hypothetical protein